MYYLFVLCDTGISLWGGALDQGGVPLARLGCPYPGWSAPYPKMCPLSGGAHKPLRAPFFVIPTPGSRPSTYKYSNRHDQISPPASLTSLSNKCDPLNIEGGMVLCSLSTTGCDPGAVGACLLEDEYTTHPPRGFCRRGPFTLDIHTHEFHDTITSNLHVEHRKGYEGLR